MMTETEVFLVDNGSLAPDATLELRGLAKALSGRLNYPVEAVSLLHSHKVDPVDLDGVRQRFEASYAGFVCSGSRTFFDNTAFSGAKPGNHGLLAGIVGGVARECPEIKVSVADCLFGKSVSVRIHA